MAQAVGVRVPPPASGSIAADEADGQPVAGALSDRLPQAAGSGGGAGAGGQIPEAIREQIAPLMAEAYGYTFWWAVALLLIAFASAFLLPWRKPEAPADTEDEAGEGTAAPVMIHA